MPSFEISEYARQQYMPCVDCREYTGSGEYKILGSCCTVCYAVLVDAKSYQNGRRHKVNVYRVTLPDSVRGQRAAQKLIRRWNWCSEYEGVTTAQKRDLQAVMCAAMLSFLNWGWLEWAPEPERP